MEVDTTLVHAAHCCAKHGCKYNHRDGDCPVVEGDVKQEHPCEFCEMDDEAAAPVVEQIVSWLEKRIGELERPGTHILEIVESNKTRAHHYRDVVRGLREGAWKA